MISYRLPSSGGWNDPSAEVISLNRAGKGSGSSASSVCTTHTFQVTYTMAAYPIDVRQRLLEVCLVPSFVDND